MSRPSALPVVVALAWGALLACGAPATPDPADDAPPAAQQAPPPAAAPAAPPPADDPAAPTAPPTAPLRAERWLTLEPVDARGRRPLGPDAVFAAHLLAPDAPPPRASDTLVGELGEARTWVARDADEGGGPADAGRIGWAHAELHAPRAGSYLAELRGAAELHVNGQALFGDVYRLGSAAEPVALRAGANSVFVSGVRGRFDLVFTPVTAELELADAAHTLPDLVAGGTRAGPLGVAVRNASDAWRHDLELVLPADALFAESRAPVEPGLAPFELARVAVPQALRRGARVPHDVERVERRVELRARGGGAPLAAGLLGLRVVPRTAARRETFVSGIDGTVQHFGLREPGAPPRDGEPATDDAEPPPTRREAPAGVLPGAAPDTRLLLSLHGAGVDARAQAAAYAPLPDFWIAAPSNRGAFGFDWQDWGRADAYEVLAQALALSGVDRRRVVLGGHSMGGHGTWHLGANDPDGFAALAPSAGWVSFDTYGGRPDGALAPLWHAADAGSDTLALLDNLAPQPIFVLHGSADDNVPASEAETMLAALRAAGASPRAHVEEGAGHWWDGDAAPGADCLTWPGIFELFRESELPRAPEALAFTSVHPAMDSRHHWVALLQAERYGEPLRVEGRWSDGALELTTRNVRRLRVSRVGGRALRTARVDGAPVDLAGHDPAREDLELLRGPGGWRRVDPGAPRGREKTPSAGGPFKRAFDGRFVLVPGTAGDDAEDAALLGLARALASEWAYRANGRAPIVTDARWLAGEAADRRPILIGNARSHAAWHALLPDAPPAVHVLPGEARVGHARLRGDDLVALFTAPTPDGVVGVVGVSGPRAARLATRAAIFRSGAGFPDFLVFDRSALQLGDGGVQAAGWFDATWALQPPAIGRLPEGAIR